MRLTPDPDIPGVLRLDDGAIFTLNDTDPNATVTVTAETFGRVNIHFDANFT